MEAMFMIPSIAAESVDDHHNHQFISKNFVKAEMISGKQKATWKNATAVAHQKRECQKAEDTWRKTKLQLD